MLKKEQLTTKEIFNESIKILLEEVKIEIKEQNIDLTNVADNKLQDVISIAYKNFNKINEFLKLNSLPSIDFTSLITAGNITEIVENISIQIQKILDGLSKEQDNLLLSFQILSPEFNAILSSKKYLHDDQIYIFESILNNKNNKNAYDENGFKYQLGIDKKLTLTKTEAGSVTPSLVFELQSSKTDLDVNQLQLSKKTNSEMPSVWDTNAELDYSKNIIPEIVVSSGYAKHNKLKIGDVIELPSSSISNTGLALIDKKDNFYVNSIKFKIVGTGEKFDDMVPGSGYTPFMQGIETYSFGYVSGQLIDEMRASRWAFNKQADREYFVNYKILNRDGGVNKLPTKAFSFTDENEMLYSFNDLPFISWSKTKIAQALNNINIQVIIYIALGVAVLVLAFIFINFTIKKEMNETRKQLGIFKSFGYKVIELSWIFALKTWITILAGIVIGYFVSIPLQIFAAGNSEATVMFQFGAVYWSPIFLVMLWIVIPGVFLLISYGLTILYLREPVLSLINHGTKINRNVRQSWFSRKLSENGKGFNFRLRRAFVKTSRGKFAIVQTLFAFSALVYTMMFGAQAIMQQTIDQGMSIVKDGTDHVYAWYYDKNIGISEATNGKYGTTNIEKYKEEALQYNNYSNSKNINAALDNNVDSSDSRYRIKILMNAVGNSISKELNAENKLAMILPFEKVLQTFGNLSKNDSTSDLYGNENYYLNPIMTFKVLDKESELLKDDIQALKEGKTLNKTIDTYKEDQSDLFLDINDLDYSKISETLFGMLPKEGNISNNLFASDVAKLLSIKIAEGYASAQMLIEVLKQFPGQDITNIKLTEEVLKNAWVNVSNNKEMLDFNPNQQKYWRIDQNPLIESLMGMNGLSSKNRDGDISTSLTGGIGSAISMDKVSLAAQTLIMGAMMLSDINGLDDEKVVTFNQLFFDEDKEHLDFYLEGIANDQKNDNPEIISLMLNDFSADSKFGDPAKQLNYQGVTSEQIESLKEDFGNENLTFNAIIPYFYAKSNDLKIGDIIEAKTNTLKKVDYKLRVTAINESITMKATRYPQIVLDYGLFRQKMFSDELNQLFEEHPELIPHSDIWSQEKMLDGDIDYRDIPGSVKKMKFSGDTVSIRIKNDAPVFASIFKGFVAEMDEFIESGKNPQVIDETVGMYTNPNLLSADRRSISLPINISKTGVKNLSNQITTMLNIFLILQTILLAIILVVVMNIVVDEAARTILTMRALGYKPFEINWVVMGSYIIGAAISFVIAYGLSLVIWQGFLWYAASEFSVYIFLPFDWKALVVTFLVLGSVIGLGWFTANKQVNRTPLNQITNFA
ncbi:FtsX-like permease family protein [[Acholeplasma] multilocale]|uniref:FtsX-like permease family protein n=1 Tax=[Acholeplasma] multilocale TaxID=264638 RepID=UPI00047A4EE8|nr:ABC transporter permease [[Acholeplasma] multilocale]